MDIKSYLFLLGVPSLLVASPAIANPLSPQSIDTPALNSEIAPVQDSPTNVSVSEEVVALPEALSPKPVSSLQSSDHAIQTAFASSSIPSSSSGKDKDSNESMQDSTPTEPPQRETSDNTSIQETPRLYGETEDTLEETSVETASTPSDQFDQMTAEEWLALIEAEEALTVQANTSVPAIPEQTELRIDADIQETPRLYGEAEDTLVETASTPSDQFDQMTAEEWLDLIEAEEALTVQANTSAPAIPEQTELRNLDIEIALPIPVTPSAYENPEWETHAEWESGLWEGSMQQLTSVSQLSDVQPTDWSFQALQSLVERYGVVSGYPDGTFRGNQSLTRYEFAAGLNAALDAITQLIDAGLAEQPTREELEILQRLQTDFSTELTALRGRVDTLESRTATIEAQQFSTTMQLAGQAIFGVATAGGGDPPGTGEANPILTYLSQLQLVGSFTEGRDLFRVGLTAGNFGPRGFADPQVLNTNMALLSYQSYTGDEIVLDSLDYRFAVGDRLVVTIQPAGFDLGSVLSTNSLYSNSGQGAISRFASESPIFKIGGLDAGVGLNFLLTDRTQFQVAYGVRNAGETSQGLFASDHWALGAQLFTQPASNLRLGFAYVYGFSGNGQLDTYTGSNNADTSGRIGEPSTIHALNGTLSWVITPDIVVEAWGGLTVTVAHPSDAAVLSSTYLLSLGFLDPFDREGDLFAILVGQPLRLEAGVAIERDDEGSGMHYEAFYRFRVNDNISITPGFFVVTDPGHIPENDTIWVAALRTTFTF